MNTIELNITKVTKGQCIKFTDGTFGTVIENKKIDNFESKITLSNCDGNIFTISMSNLLDVYVLK